MTQAIKTSAAPASPNDDWVNIEQAPPVFPYPNPLSTKTATWYKKFSQEDREGTLELMSQSVALLDKGKTVSSLSLQALSISEWIAKQYYGLQVTTNASLIIQAVATPFAFLSIVFSSIQGMYEGYQFYKAREMIGKINKLKDIHADPLKFLTTIEKKYFNITTKELAEIDKQMKKRLPDLLKKTLPRLALEKEIADLYKVLREEIMQPKYAQLSRKTSPAFAKKCQGLPQLLDDLDNFNEEIRNKTENTVQELIDSLDIQLLEKIERKYINLTLKEMQTIENKIDSIQGLSDEAKALKRAELRENARALKYAQLTRRVTPWCAEKLYKELSEILANIKSEKADVRAKAKEKISELIQLMDAQSSKKWVAHLISLVAILCGIVSLALTVAFPPAAFIILGLTAISILLGLIRMLLDYTWLNHEGNYLSFKKSKSTLLESKAKLSTESTPLIQ